MQILEYQRGHRGSEQQRAFVGCDSVPITFEVRTSMLGATYVHEASDMTSQLAARTGLLFMTSLYLCGAAPFVYGLHWAP